MAEPPPTSTRRERRKLELRGRMLEAAVALFDEHGVHATKVADICARADVAQKTFFNHFASKEQLLRELARRGARSSCSRTSSARARPARTHARAPRALLRAASPSAPRSAGPMHRELLTELIHAIHDSGTEPEQARRLHAAFGALVRDGLAAGDVTRAARARDAHRDDAGRLLRADVQLGEPRRLPDPRAAPRAAARFLADALARRHEEE